LNGRAQGHIARHEQQAIIDAARELNYTPNAVAVSLRNRRTRTIGVLTWSSPGGFSVPMLHPTLKTTTAAGYLSIFMDTANDRDHQSQALATLRDRQVDALLVIALISSTTGLRKSCGPSQRPWSTASTRAAA
jgi:LacI family transcriptional regulator